MEYDGNKQNNDMQMGASVGVEILKQMKYDILKIGFGVEYLYYRALEIENVEKEYDSANNIWVVIGRDQLNPLYTFLPIYITIQVNPFSKFEGLFVKGNVGYIAFAEAYLRENHNNITANLYWAALAGYEFKSGFLFDVSYSAYYLEADDVTATYYKFGCNVGYKFKL